MVSEKIYTWKTSKVANGFKFSVEELTPRKTANKQGQFVDTKIIKTGTLPTRARAKTMAQKWVRFFKSQK